MTLPDDAAIAAVPLPTYAAAMAVAYGCCYALAKTCLRQAPCVAVAGDAIFGLVYYPLLFVLALDASFDLYADATLRWTGTTSTSVVLGKLLVSRMVVHMPYIFLKRSREEVELRPMYVVHHCIVIVAYGAGVARSLSHFWGAAAALCEATNVFLTVDELLLSAPGVRARPWLAAPQRWLQRGFKLPASSPGLSPSRQQDWWPRAPAGAPRAPSAAQRARRAGGGCTRQTSCPSRRRSG